MIKQVGQEEPHHYDNIEGWGSIFSFYNISIFWICIWVGGKGQELQGKNPLILQLQKVLAPFHFAAKKAINFVILLNKPICRVELSIK